MTNSWHSERPTWKKLAFHRFCKWPVIKRGRIICFANSRSEAQQIAGALNHVEEYEAMCARLHEEYRSPHDYGDFGIEDDPFGGA